MFSSAKLLRSSSNRGALFGVLIILISIIIVFVAATTTVRAQQQHQQEQEESSSDEMTFEEEVMMSTEEGDGDGHPHPHSHIHRGSYDRHPKDKPTCPIEGAPKIGDIKWIHVPSYDHLVPRYHGLRVFAPVDHTQDHSGKTTHEIVHGHLKAKLLYVFNEFALQGVWPVHAHHAHDYRNLKIAIRDLVVQKEVQDGEEVELCLFKVQII